ncbi:MAG: histidine-type phosphatase [Alistipes sp.]|nr:histidine-type phosphatase [Alistipes sp.]
MRVKLLFAALLGCVATASAQKLDADFFAQNPDAAGGIYYTYRFTESEMTPVPKGYKPFYISHFGRHGSRWHASKGVYTYPQAILAKAAEQGGLTEFGREVYAKVDAIAKRARGREAELSPQGIAEHRGIAERMYRSFPKLFKGKRAFVESRSSDVPRCILSMAAFNERLKELNPALKIYRTTNDSVQIYLRPWLGGRTVHDVAAKVTNPQINAAIAKHIPHIARRLFTEQFIAAQDSAKFFSPMRTLFYLSICMQDTEGELRLHDIYTPQERAEIWEQINKHRYALYGATERWGDAILGDGANLVNEIVRDADELITAAAQGDAPRTAYLRFGHDYTVIAALATMQVVGKSVRTDDLDNLKDVWVDFQISPMATNLQWIFYRNKQGEVLVKLLHNEQECLLPIDSPTAPYYRWTDARDFLKSRIDEIASLPAVKALPKARFYTVGQ